MTDQLTPDMVAAIDEANRVAWARTAPTYAANFGLLTGDATAPLLDAAGVGRGTALLDIGTGPGTILGSALERGAHIAAVDLTDEMVAEARQRFPSVDVRVANATQLPFGDGSFDAVTFAFSLHHMAEPVRALAEAHRVLRPGGRISLTVWGPWERLEAFAVAFAALESLEVELDEAPPTPLIGAPPEVFMDLFERAGLSQPFVRDVDVAWRVEGSAGIVDGFERFVGLQGQSDEVRARFAASVDHAVRARAEAGVTVLPNPAVLAAARRNS